MVSCRISSLPCFKCHSAVVLSYTPSSTQKIGAFDAGSSHILSVICLLYILNFPVNFPSFKVTVFPSHPPWTCTTQHDFNRRTIVGTDSYLIQGSRQQVFGVASAIFFGWCPLYTPSSMQKSAGLNGSPNASKKIILLWCHLGPRNIDSSSGSSVTGRCQLHYLKSGTLQIR